MGRKLDPTNKVKRGPGKKARKQQGAETELVKFIKDGNYAHCFTGPIKMGNVNSAALVTLSFSLQKNLNQNVCRGEPGNGERSTDNLVESYLVVQIAQMYHLLQSSKTSADCKEASRTK